MKSFYNSIHQILQEFFRGPQFLKSLVLTVGVTMAIAFFNLIDRSGLAISAAIGVLLSSASDVQGPLRKKVTAIVLATTLAVFATIVVSLASAYTYILLPTLLVFMFFTAYMAVYGFRASLISFSGLLAAVLAMAGLRENPIFVHALFMGIGGLWYLLLSLTAYFLNPKKETDHLLADCFDLTATFVKTRAQLLSGELDRKELQEKQLFLQNDINEKHEAVRELLISSRRNSGSSKTQRQKLYVFIELVDILELAMANPVDYERIDAIFHNEKPLKQSFETLITGMSLHLEKFSKVVRRDNATFNFRLAEADLKAVEREVAKYINNNAGDRKEAALILQNLYDYQEKQFQKISLITKVLSKPGVKFTKIQPKEASQFLTTQEYSFNIFRENFNFKSPIFKHSLRLVLVVLLGVLIGNFFELQNMYWILLTVVVILRPNYGLTKERSKQRIIGTLFGAVVAAAIVFLFPYETVYIVLAIISLLLAFSLIQQNYKWAAGFITVNVVFIYALLSPNAFDVIQFRVLDTAIGAGLAYLGILFLWPSWEYRGIENFISESIKANKAYLQQISLFYNQKEKLPTSYKLSRKQAFLAMGNLSAAFQRMTQEPRSKQKDIGKIYEIVVLNQTFLSSAASLGTYIQNHATTAASVHFEALVRHIQQNMDKSLAQLQQKEVKGKVDEEKKQLAQEYLDGQYKQMVNSGAALRTDTGTSLPEEQNLRELQLVKSQLKWLLDVSEKLQKVNLSTNKFS